MPPEEKASLNRLRDKDLLNPNHGRDKLVDRLRVRPPRPSLSQSLSPVSISGFFDSVLNPRPAAQAAAEFVSDFNPDASVAPLDLIAQLAIDPKITRHKCAPRPPVRPATPLALRH